ncbi:glycoside hydrolase family 2 TIM barrel-domain containing protein [Aestuariibaculum sp. YM273]|uniref:glycoside hydrolase family 2 protein n=1 Tax=Aestuariibaculum sp. YM273 TaxID=3070659 RepID=UPI0027DB3B94|nr:glycoside hydrolase family 2 TIM barrel-domain containing protein [Aestuariibaculum sp. YM273]WMI66234.1 glycoside hydrolase family 2 TIM barrel-domain containing protein [Aestuariibaculum sp. YM273]
MIKFINKLSFVLALAGLSAVAQNTEIQYLSGTGYQDTKEWEFKISDGRKSGEWSTINVPSVWEQEGFGKYQYGIRFYGKPFPEGIADEVGEYKYKFTVPKAWENKIVKIVFDGSMTDTKVRINGRSASDDTHQGAFYRFKYDITDLLKFGKENVLEVTVSKESKNASVNLAERRADYWNFGGIFRPVFLEALPATHIDYTSLKAEADGSFEANVFLGKAGQNVSAEITILDEKGKRIGSTMKAEAVNGSDKLHLAGQFENIKQWTAETPNLYTAEIKLLKAGKVVHEIKETIGFRTIEIRKGDGIYVNGQRVLMKGVNRHSFWPESGRTLNTELNYADVRLIKEMNMNAVRLSHYPPDPDFLKACDELGLYVMNELGGWHGHYDDAVGKKLVKEMVTRDLNHVSIIFWSNGNEGGWNTNLDDQFDIWDLQKRPVLHPQQEHNGVETMHYRSYGETLEYFRDDNIFMPTEYLHGLYDGGHGAGFDDYWEVMRKHPRSGGGYLWVFADEGIARTDQDGRIDNQGNYGADGIVGPHHEKEGSFFTVKEVWSPVMIMNKPELSNDFDGTFSIENRYDFTNTNTCTFEYELVSFTSPLSGKAERKTVNKGTIKAPSIEPHGKGELKINLPGNWKDADVLYVKATNANGEELWTWDFTWDKESEAKASASGNVDLNESDEFYTVSASGTVVKFDKVSGKLVEVTQNGNTISLANGPKIIMARRGDRTLDGTVNPEFLKGEDRIYKEFACIDEEVNCSENLLNISAKEVDGKVVIEANYHGILQKVVWTIDASGLIQLDYEYEYNGVVDLAGVYFEYPEEKMQHKKWLGDGPYRVWQNRLKGTTLDIWENDYNDPIPGESFNYPEFKGYFNNWQWAEFTTEEGKIYIENKGTDTYLGVYSPRDGRDALLYTIPNTGIAVLDVIPPARNKVNATDLCGPSSQPKWLSGLQKRTVYLKFDK